MKSKIKKNELYGIRQDVINLITSTIYLNNKIEKIIIFGSRAKGSYKKGSDIDLAIVAENLNFSELLQIKSELNQLPIPYNIDIVDFNKIENMNLIEHIERVGKIL